MEKRYLLTGFRECLRNEFATVSLEKVEQVKSDECEMLYEKKVVVMLMVYVTLLMDGHIFSAIVCTILDWISLLGCLCSGIEYSRSELVAK